MKIKMFMFAALAAFATLAGCSDDNDTTGGGGTTPPPVKPSEYEVDFLLQHHSDDHGDYQQCQVEILHGFDVGVEFFERVDSRHYAQ